MAYSNQPRNYTISKKGHYVPATDNIAGLIFFDETDRDIWLEGVKYTTHVSYYNLVSTQNPLNIANIQIDGVTTGIYVPRMLGATATTDGGEGLVPRPVRGQQNYVLVGAGSWVDISSIVTQVSFVDVDFSGQNPLTLGTLTIGSNQYVIDVPTFGGPTQPGIVRSTENSTTKYLSAAGTWENIPVVPPTPQPPTLSYTQTTYTGTTHQIGKIVYGGVDVSQPVIIPKFSGPSQLGYVSSTNDDINKFLRGDGTWQAITVPTYPTLGAGSQSGTSYLVNGGGTSSQFLAGDGTWQSISIPVIAELFSPKLKIASVNGTDIDIPKPYKSTVTAEYNTGFLLATHKRYLYPFGSGDVDATDTIYIPTNRIVPVLENDESKYLGSDGQWHSISSHVPTLGSLIYTDTNSTSFTINYNTTSHINLGRHLSIDNTGTYPTINVDDLHTLTINLPDGNTVTYDGSADRTVNIPVPGTRNDDVIRDYHYVYDENDTANNIFETPSNQDYLSESLVTIRFMSYHTHESGATLGAHYADWEKPITLQFSTTHTNIQGTILYKGQDGVDVPLTLKRLYIEAGLDGRELTRGIGLFVTLHVKDDYTAYFKTAYMRDIPFRWSVWRCRPAHQIWENYTPPEPEPTPTVLGNFTVDSAGTQITFAHGNLQYQASTNTWRFAEHQYDFIGDNPGNNVWLDNGRATQSDWIDLFAKGCNGVHHDGTTDEYQPYSYYDFDRGTTLYGGLLVGDYSFGCQPIVDRGVTIPNGTYREFTFNEFSYILENRTYQGQPMNRYAFGYVNGALGLIIVPDNNPNNMPAGVSLQHFNQYINSTVARDNTISAADWDSIYDPLGFVFLPFSGYMFDEVMNLNVGYYITNSTSNSQSYYFELLSGSNNAYIRCQRGSGNYSVRLVKTVTNE